MEGRSGKKLRIRTREEGSLSDSNYYSLTDNDIYTYEDEIFPFPILEEPDLFDAAVIELAGIISEPDEVLPDILELADFFDRQEEGRIIADEHEFFLYGGAKGPGKSYFLRWYLLYYLDRIHKEYALEGVRVMLACENYPTLYERQLVKIAVEFRGLGEWIAGPKEFRLRPEYGSGVIAFRNLDDPAKYDGAEFAVVAIDEITRNKRRTFDLMRGPLRWPGLPDEELKLIGASNPTGIGKKFVREFFIEKKLTEEEEYLRDKIAYLPGSPRDNPHLSPGYWRNLNTLPTPLREAWVEGNWYVSFEGLVYGSFSNENVLDHDWEPEFGDDELPLLEVELAYDEGYTDPRAILFIQRTGSEIFVFDEIYVRQELPEKTVERIIERMVKYFGRVERKDRITAKWEPVFDEDGNEIPKVMPAIAIGDPSAAVLRRQLRDANIPTRRPGIKDVREGISHVRGLIEDGQGYRVVKVHPRCSNLITELTEGYIYPEEGTRSDEEKPIDANNHAADALRYYLTARVKRRE